MNETTIPVVLEQAEYRSLTEIAIAAETYLRSGSAEAADALQIAVLTSKAWSDEEEEIKWVNVRLQDSLARWLADFLGEVIKFDRPDVDYWDGIRASSVRNALSSVIR